MLDLFELGLHHEQQHQELILTDLKHLFSRNPLAPVYRMRGREPAGPSPRWSGWLFHRGVREIGHRGAQFCFDNELPRHRVYI